LERVAVERRWQDVPGVRGPSRPSVLPHRTSAAGQLTGSTIVCCPSLSSAGCTTGR
jgi:hypothetical protein